MPKIAQYEPDQVRSQVVTQPLAQDAPPGTFGNQIAKGVADVVNAGLQMKQRIDITSSEEALVQFERDKNDIFFNPDTGYFNTQGRDAYDKSSDTSKALEELKKKYGETLNAQSKQLFDRAADAHIARSSADIARHASKGLKAWEIATIESQLENSLENASLYWNDPDRLRVQNVLGRQAIIDSSDLMGLGPEATAEKLQTFESTFANSTISAAIQSSADEGRVAFKEYGDRLEGPDKVKIKAAIDRKTNIEKTQSDAVAAILTASRLVDQYENRSDIVEEVNKIEDAELRKKIMTETMTQFNRKKQAEREQENDYYQIAIGQVNDGLSPTEIESKNPEVWLGMTDIQRNNILSGKHQLTDQVVLANFRLLGVKEKAAFEPMSIADKVKPADLQKVISEVNAAKKGKQGSRVKSLTSKAIDAAEGAFGKRSSWKKRSGGFTEKGKLANDFLSDLQDAIDEFEENKQSKITPAEENQIISEFTQRIVVERSAFGLDFLAPDIEIDLSNTPANDVRVLNRIINNTPNIDVKDLTDAYQFLIDNNQPVTVTSLKNVYEQGTK